MSIDDLRAYAIRQKLDFYEVHGGIGICFRDGSDVFWALPEEQWHFLNRKPSSMSVVGFCELNDRRERVVDAVRRHLAKRKISTDRQANGDWSVSQGGWLDGLLVGAGLTQKLTNESDLVAAVCGVFAGNIIRVPSEKNVQRLLDAFGKPFQEIPWSDEDEDEDTTEEIPGTLLDVLCRIERCRALMKGVRLEPSNALAAVTKPKRRIGRALLQVAQRLPHTTAALACDDSLSLDYDDEYESFDLTLKSKELRNLVRTMGPERAGDHLANEYERLNAARKRVLSAVYQVLDRHGYVTDSTDERHVLY